MSDATQSEPVMVVPLVFAGKASEYFRIWIVNLFLSVVTLGIYSAWAKVRRLRYFYGNITLAGHHFDFVGDPKRILRGRILAASFFVTLAILEKFSRVDPTWIRYYFGLLLLLILLLPWVITRGRQFMLHNTVHRNLHFNFTGSLHAAYLTFLGRGMLVLLTLGVYTPFYFYHMQNFLISNSHFGIARFRMTGTRKDFGIHYGKALLLLILFYLALIGLIVSLTLFMNIAMRKGSVNPFASLLLPLGYLAGFILLTAFYSLMRAAFLTAMGQAALNQTILGNGHRIQCRLRILPLTWIFWSNLLANLVSMGLLIPWSRIRMTRHLTGCITVLVQGNLDDFTAGQLADTHAAGAEFDDALGMDLSLT